MNINCAILSIGSELLEGSVVDTNSAFLGKNLAAIGIKPLFIRMVPDDCETIISAMKEASKTYPLIFTTGGLGPTFDDLTSECAAKASGVSLEFSDEAYNHMAEILKRVNVEIRDSHKRQAMLPKGALHFMNPVGTAFGFGVRVGDSLVISMPGVPAEMTEMFNNYIVPYLKSHYQLPEIHRREINFASVPESDVDRVILEHGIPSGVECIINAGKGVVVVKLRGTSKTDVEKFAEHLARSFPSNFTGYGSATPAALLVNILSNKGATISTAESCTGGTIAKFLTDIAGVSSVYTGSVVSYSNDIKQKLLSVSAETLKKYGAVSAETAEEMAKGALKTLGTDYAISITGIAGPDGGSAEKPVGTVYFAVASAKNISVKLLNLRGTREQIRERSANAALFHAAEFIRNE